MLEVYGQLIRAQLQISATDLSPTATGLIYFNTTTGVKWHNGTAWKIAADLDSSQTLTNKNLGSATNVLTGATAGSFINTGTITLPTVTGTLALVADITTTALTMASKTFVQPLIDNYFDINEEAAPGTPAANTVRIYAKADGKLYKKDDTGVESEVGSGAGSTVKNYLQDWFDGTRAIAVSATTLGATSNRTTDQALWARSTVAGLTIENNAVSPLRPLGDFLINSSAATINSFVESPLFAIDSADVGKTIIIEFDLTGIAAITNYDIVVVRYNSAGTYQDTISVAGNASTGTPASAQLPVGTATFSGFFIPSGTSTDLYSIRLRKVAAVDDDFQIDSLFVGKQVALQGAIVTAWQAYTPTYTGLGTVTSSEMYWRRNGDQLEVRGNFTTGTTTATEARLSFPDASTTAAAFPSIRIAGSAIRAGSSATFFSDNVLSEPSVSYFTFGVQSSTTSGLTKSLGTAFSSATKETIYASTNISQWQSGTTTLADRAVEEYAYNTDTSNGSNTSSFGYGIDGVAFGSYTVGPQKRVRFTTPILSTDRIFIEILASGSNSWLPIEVLNNYASLFVEVGGTNYGMRLFPANSTDVDVIFGVYRKSNSATYGAAGAPWSDLTTSKWRLRKVSGGAAVGFPVSTANLTDKNKIQKKTLSTTATATSGATVQLPSLTLNNLVVGKNYRLHMHGYLTCFVNATGAVFAAIHNGAQLALVYYEPLTEAANRFMAAGTTQLFTAAATTVTFQFSNTSGPNGSSISGAISWVILEELNDTDLSTAFT